MATKFIHLRNHTEYSLCSGTIRLKEFVKFATENKIPALTMTDSHNMFGALEFSMMCCKAGVQPILGCELVVDANEFLADSSIQSFDKMEENFCKLVVIAKNDEGFANLSSILSQSYLKRQDKLSPFVNLDLLSKKNKGLIVLSGGIEGIYGKAILNEKMNKIDKINQYFQDNFADNFYMEIQRHGWNDEIKTETHFIDIALKNNIPLVATNDCYFMEKNMFEAQDALLCIGLKYKLEDKDRPKYTPEHYFKTEDEMVELFKDIPEAIENTVKIAKRIGTMAYTRKPTLPHYMLPDGVSEAEEMERISRKGLEERLQHKFIVDDISDPQEQEKVREQYIKQLEFEMDVIKQMDFPGYFLIVADFIVWSKTHGVPIGPGRGSGAGSVVAWSMKITDLDPIKFGLFFERFLNPERVSMPDFDVDFCQRGRGRSIEYVQNKYGKDMVAQIVTFGKLKSRAAVMNVGRVLNMHHNDVRKITSVIPDKLNLTEALKLDADLSGKIKNDTEMNKLFDISLKLEDLNRNASVHAAGIVIGDKPLEQICPLYVADKNAKTISEDDEDDEDENEEAGESIGGMPVVQYDKHFCEDVGLVKFDFLGLKTLTTIKDALDFIKSVRNIDLDISNIRLDDKETFTLLKSADTLAVFQIESGGMKSMLKQIQPDNIEDIIALISLFRPGPMDNIPTYIKRKHGQETIEYLHPKMEPILRNTYGIIVYQEQVMDIAKSLAGYSLGGADLLRRAMGKKIPEIMAQQRSVFVEGCKNFSNIDEKKSNEIFDLLAKFAEYGFNKAHAAAYGVISYQTAYLKAHYPVEFMTATLNMEINNTDKINFYLQDIKEHKIVVLPPDINKSNPYFNVELIDIEGERNKPDIYYFGDKELAIRYGLGAIKGVGTDLTKNIKSEVERNGEFKNIFDFCARVGSRIVNKKVVESLAKSGSFDSIHKNRKQISDSCEILSLYAKSKEEEKKSVQISLFGDMEKNDEKMLPKLVNTDDWIGSQKYQMEFEAFGFYLDNHPLDTIKEELKSKGIVFYDELKAKINERAMVKIAGIVISSSIKSNERGRYARISLSDPTGTMEVMLNNGDLITERKDWIDKNEHNQLVFECTVSRDDSGLKINAKNLWLLDNYLKNTKAGQGESIKILGHGSFKDYKRKKEEKEEKSEEKIVFKEYSMLKEIKIHIKNENCLADLSRILEKAHFPERDKHTEIKLLSTDGDVIALPNEYYITEIEINRIKSIFGIWQVEIVN